MVSTVKIRERHDADIKRMLISKQLIDEIVEEIHTDRGILLNKLEAAEQQLQDIARLQRFFCINAGGNYPAPTLEENNNGSVVLHSSIETILNRNDK